MYNWASHSTLRNAKFRFGEAAKPPLGKLRAAKPKHFGAATQCGRGGRSARKRALYQ